MAFPESTVLACWNTIGGVCESCRKTLAWQRRGREGLWEWEAHHIDGNPTNDSESNCRILCWSCQKETF